MISARSLAVKILSGIDKNNSFSNIALSSELKKYNLNKLDSSLVSSIVYGVLQRKLTIEAVIASVSDKSLKKMHPIVFNTLTVAVYQILFMEKIPSFAAVNEAVKIVKNSKQGYAAGFVNAVLHKVVQNRTQILSNIDSTDDLSIKFSANKSFINELISDFGYDTALSFLSESLKSPKGYIRINPIKTDVNTLISELTDREVICSKTEIEYGICVEKLGNIEDITEFNNGLFYVQDLSSQIALSKLNIHPGMSVIDVCAAPGGKSFTAAGLLHNEGRVVSCDIYENRVDLINNGAKRLGFSCVVPLVNDASLYNAKLGKFDRVICDVPCSGYGVIRRKPEIRYKDTLEFTDLPSLQLQILNSSVKYLNDNGLIMYSTCTVRKVENQDVVRKFLFDNNEFEIVLEQTLLPHLNDCDGFYYCIMKRK